MIVARKKPRVTPSAKSAEILSKLRIGLKRVIFFSQTLMTLVDKEQNHVPRKRLGTHHIFGTKAGNGDVVLISYHYLDFYQELYYFIYFE